MGPTTWYRSAVSLTSPIPGQRLMFVSAAAETMDHSRPHTYAVALSHLNARGWLRRVDLHGVLHFDPANRLL
jgi:hypothetical protein